MDIVTGRDTAPVAVAATRPVSGDIFDAPVATTPQTQQVGPTTTPPRALPVAEAGAGAPAVGSIEGTIGDAYDDNVAAVADMRETLSEAQAAELETFRAHYEANRARYDAVSTRTGIPSALVAAIHWRESSGDFTTYLHQGDPLGVAAVHVPTNIPVFTVWEDAAVHALSMADKVATQTALGITAETRDAASMATYAEGYNGLGYQYRDQPSPYAFSGTSEYTRGKFVGDHDYSATTVDRQLGVMSMVGAVGGMDAQIRPVDWTMVTSGRTQLRRGDSGQLVGELQTRLAAKGHPCGSDSTFGPGVERAVKAFQRANNIGDDGVVGAGTAALL